MADQKNPSKQTVLSLSDTQIKRLDELVKFNGDPLNPVKELIEYIVQTIDSQKGQDVTSFDTTELRSRLPKKGDIAAIAHLMPGAMHAQLSEGSGWNDGGDYDYRVSSDHDGGPIGDQT